MGNMEDDQAAREANKICGVCGDRALGYNFNAVSCESCKAFFRRNALKNKEFRCPFSENCSITPVTRRFCQKCRLDKCFRIGMKKEYIMSDEDKVLKRQKIEQNRAKKRPCKENYKAVKAKKESLDDPNFDDSTSIPSVASVASVMSESYFWESDKKYADLDANKQSTVDSLSPVAAACVPSPSSPPQNCDIASTVDIDIPKGSPSQVDCPSQVNFYSSAKESIESKGQSNKVNESVLKSSNRYCLRSINSSVSSPNCSKLEKSPPAYTMYKLPEEEKSHNDLNECLSSNEIEETVPSVPIHCSEEAIMCQKSKENCINRTDLVTKMIHDPELVAKLVTNPNVIANVIIQDQSLFTKFIKDPEIISKLASDPQILQYLEEDKTVSSRIQETVKTNSHPERYLDNKISSNLNKNVIDSNRGHVENPILTNLITTHRKEELNQRNDIPTTSEWHDITDEVTRDVLQDVERIPITANSIESILCEAIKLEFSAYSSFGGSHYSRELNDAERAKLNELIVANKALLAPLDDDITNLIGEECKFKANPDHADPALLDVINLTAIAIRRLIKMSKKINAFKNMCQEDQLALLKGGCTEMMMLRSAINYDPDKDSWKIPHSQDRISNIKAEILKKVKGNLYAEHARFVRTFDSRWRDENIILILCAITLFSPDRPRVVHKDVIKLEQNSYYYLLRRYLESIYPGCEAKSTFMKLIQKISDLHRLNEEVVGVYLNVNPSDVEPLLIEIFDLKH
ncbi:uncharacterized protein LOC131664991 isoform X2 [Phymastichus coffea]|uniref:uncharacterized protein LOC131664991 isoform X2 n=1 Tax=Phymastichus coffea TaxID=108790 RepID=UPI00273A8158|nr:uncharacterized protein LOC131664991 isoform X2 [Phymastichus coffea]